MSSESKTKYALAEMLGIMKEVEAFLPSPDREAVIEFIRYAVKDRMDWMSQNETVDSSRDKICFICEGRGTIFDSENGTNEICSNCKGYGLLN